MQLHEMKRQRANRRSRRVGRGGKRGKTSGRGHKGQNARAGSKRRPEWRDIIKKFPKRRGYGKNRSRTVVPKHAIAGVNLGTLSERFKDGDIITPRVLVSAGIINRISGRIPLVKILGNGDLSKKLTFTKVRLSAVAKEKVAKGGGAIVAQVNKK